MPCIIYALIAPDTGKVRYVGQSRKGIKRVKDHAMPSHHKQERLTHKTKWVQKLIRRGVMFVPRILEVVDNADDLDSREIFWIDFYHSLGHPLTNGTSGGQGTIGYKPTAEHKRKVSEAQKGEKGFWFGKKQSAEVIERRLRTLKTKRVVDSNGNTFRSQAEAARFYGVSDGAVRCAIKSGGNCACGQGKREGGVKFKFLEEQ